MSDVFSVLSRFQSSSMKRPIIPTDFGAKVPTNVRQRYLNTFIDECVKFCPSEDAAFQMVWKPPITLQPGIWLGVTDGFLLSCSL